VKKRWVGLSIRNWNWNWNWNLTNNIKFVHTEFRILWLRKHKPKYYPHKILKYSTSFKVIHRRNFSQVTNNLSKDSLVPVVVYPDAYLNKSLILKDGKNKAGIYRWVNKVNGKTYIGSSVNLARRFRVYYDLSFLSVRLEKAKSHIYSAILKHGYSNFQLEILEYCTKENAISREQYYIDLLNPEYNLNSTAGSRLGAKLSEESRLKKSQAAQGHKHTEETKNLISLANKGINNESSTNGEVSTIKGYIIAKLDSVERAGKAIEVANIHTNEVTRYSSISSASEALGISQASISTYLSRKRTSPFRDIYHIKLI